MDVTINGWYGNCSYPLQFLSHTALWYHTGKPLVPIRWVLVKDPLHKFEHQAFLCTDVTQSPSQILFWFRHRSQMEVIFLRDSCSFWTGDSTTMVSSSHPADGYCPTWIILYCRSLDHWFTCLNGKLAQEQNFLPRKWRTANFSLCQPPSHLHKTWYD